MNGETENETPADEIEDENKDVIETQEALDDPIEIDTVGSDDNVGDISVEINVEELIAKIEVDESDEAVKKRAAHRKLEELNERRKVEEDLGSTYNINLDDDL
jgi:hypothetical protein